ncbi:MAG: putative amidophosphoribosyltransferase [Microgenomates group bacterium LiPW_16]|nr:MAG: putative amidophosphoribosyltransferase [Microgenomates group bacterium LiPW_16]
MRTVDFVLTPVPLHWWRLRWRGFNQAEILGKMIAEKLEIKFVPDLLTRKKPTRPQVELEGKARRENIASNILLFDDVWTTGVTLRACGNVLKRAGVKSVWGLTLAK